MNKAEWENWVNLVLGVWIFFVPWTFQTEALAVSTATVANWNFWLVGAVVIVSAAMAIDELKPWEEWLNLALGLWLVVSPWAMGYASAKALMLNSLIIGVAIMVFSGIALPIAQRSIHQKQSPT